MHYIAFKRPWGHGDSGGRLAFAVFAHSFTTLWYVRMHVLMWQCARARMSVYLCVSSACLYACTSVRLYVCTSVCLYVCMSECLYVCMYYVCMSVCMHVCMCHGYVHVHVCRCHVRTHSCSVDGGNILINEAQTCP